LANGLVVGGQAPSPAPVTETTGMLGGTDDVGEQKRRQDALALGWQQPLQDARPLDRDCRLVADRPAITTRRDVVDGSGARL
jgi:hypothetical protein